GLGRSRPCARAPSGCASGPDPPRSGAHFSSLSRACQHVSAVGRLRASHSNETRPLEAYSLVGRSPSCAVVLKDERVSYEHACLKYVSRGWVLRDLGSTNGTWLNGHKVAPGADAGLGAGDAIAFGESDLVWRLEDAAPPEPMAVSLLGGEPSVLIDGV